MSGFPAEMLVATDGSREAARAERMAVGLSGRLGSGLHVVYVGPIPDAYAEWEWTVFEPVFLSRMYERAEEEARTKLDERVGSIVEAGGEVAEAHARVGPPDVEIVDLAEELGVGLVVLGSRGFGPLRRALMGSVSGSVMRHAHASVLVVRDGRERDFLPGNVLLALDGSEEAAAAARVSVEVCRATGSELHIVYVLPAASHMPYPPAHAAEGWESSLERAEQNARTFVEEQAARMEAGGGAVAGAHVSFGRADEEIVRLSEELDAGLVVVGSRGLGGVRRVLIGSVSESVVHHAHCPVLVVRRQSLP